MSRFFEMRNKKGSVNLTVINGLLVLSLPRFLFGDKKRIFLGVPDTPINRRAAEEKKAVIEADIAFDRFDYSLEKYKRNNPIEIEEINLLDLWDNYVNYKAKMVSNTTIKKDFEKIRNHLKRLPTTELRNSRKIRDYAINNLSIDTCRRLFIYINAACEWGKNEGIIQKNYFQGLIPKLKQSHQQINPFTREERDLIIKLFAESEHAKIYLNFVKFLFYTGCRTSEAIALKWSNIDNNFTKITFSEAIVLKERKTTKTGKIRIFPINQQLRELLLDQKQTTGNQDYVFTSLTGLIIDPHNFSNRYWKEIITLAGIEHRSPYHTRHTFISICLEEGLPVVQIARWVGNSPKTIWEHYAGLTNKNEVPEF